MLTESLMKTIKYEEVCCCEYVILLTLDVRLADSSKASTIGSALHSTLDIAREPVSASPIAVDCGARSIDGKRFFDPVRLPLNFVSHFRGAPKTP